MAGLVVLQGPEPPGGDVFCALCAGMWKHAAIASRRDEITGHERGGAGTKTMSLVPTGPGWDPAVAVAWGLVPAIGAALPLCWTHLAAIDSRGGRIIPAGPVSLDGSR